MSRARIVWLPSYPKSGGTYLRMLLYHYFYFKPDGCKSVDVNTHIPDVHNLISSRKALTIPKNKLFFIKTHFSYSETHPAINNTEAFIYLIRNPRDVLLSCARWFGVSSDNKLLDEFAEAFINNLGAPQFNQSDPQSGILGMGTWIEHYRSWLSATEKYNGIIIKYEDLCSDTTAVLTQIIKILGIEPDKNKIKIALSECTIDKMSKQEKKEKEQRDETIYPDLPNGQYFIGEGKTNQSLSCISDDIESLYVEKFGPLIDQLGYR